MYIKQNTNSQTIKTQISGVTLPFPASGKGLGWGSLTPGPSPKAERGAFSPWIRQLYLS